MQRDKEKDAPRDCALVVQTISLHELVTANLNEVFLILGTNFSTCKENERRTGSLLYKCMWYHYLRQEVHVKAYKRALDYLIKM